MQCCFSHIDGTILIGIHTGMEIAYTSDIWISTKFISQLFQLKKECEKQHLSVHLWKTRWYESLFWIPYSDRVILLPQGPYTLVYGRYLKYCTLYSGKSIYNQFTSFSLTISTLENLVMHGCLLLSPSH